MTLGVQRSAISRDCQILQAGGRLLTAKTSLGSILPVLPRSRRLRARVALSHASGFIVSSAGMKASRGIHGYVSGIVLEYDPGALAHSMREVSSRKEMAGRVPAELTMSPERGGFSAQSVQAICREFRWNIFQTEERDHSPIRIEIAGLVEAPSKSVRTNEHGAPKRSVVDRITGGRLTKRDAREAHFGYRDRRRSCGDLDLNLGDVLHIGCCKGRSVRWRIVTFGVE